MIARILNTRQEANVSHKPRSVTKWNLLALLVALGGAVATIGVSQAYIHHWSRTGEKYTLTQPNEVPLPAGQSLVYYESRHAVPSGGIIMYLFGPDGEKYFASRPRDTNSYHAYLSGMSGTALWELNLPVSGVYLVTTYNGHVLSNADIPGDDRIVFLKSPNTLAEVRTVQTAIQVTGASVTLALVALLYLVHLREIRSRRSDSAADHIDHQLEGLEDEMFINPAEV